MKIEHPFNKYTLKEIFNLINNYKKYTNFNTLGLYRSIVENKNLDIEQKIKLREYANKIFHKTFDFLQLKDPQTYFNVSTLGEKLTIADERQVWKNIISNQEKILKIKRIKHRNFGDYSKHNCGDNNCIYDGMMIKQGSSLSEKNMHFVSDKTKRDRKEKSKRYKRERKSGENSITDDTFK
jgi:hypothetical protein